MTFIVWFVIVLLIVGLARLSVWLTMRMKTTPSVEEVKPVPDMVKVTVTYNDGTTETFQKDGEIEYCDGAGLMIRLEDRCVTISPFAYRKVEELHI